MDELKLDRLELPKGGWVEFNDPEDIRGKDVDRLRAAWQSTRIVGEALNTTMRLAAEILIRDWRPLGFTDAMPMPEVKAFWPELGWRDKQAIEKHMEGVVSELCGLNAFLGVRAPQTPASE